MSQSALSTFSTLYSLLLYSRYSHLACHGGNSILHPRLPTIPPDPTYGEDYREEDDSIMIENICTAFGTGTNWHELVRC